MPSLPVIRSSPAWSRSRERRSEAQKDNEPQDRKEPSPGPGRRPYPLHKVAAAIDPAKTDGVVAALEDAGFARDRIEVVTAEDVSDLEEPVGGSGIRGFLFLTSFNLSLGHDLDQVEQARRELMYGHALVLVMVGDGRAGPRARRPARARRPRHALLRPLGHHLPRRRRPLTAPSHSHSQAGQSSHHR